MTATQEDPSVRRKAAESAAFVDADIHPVVPAQRLADYLAEPWRTRLLRYGNRIPSPPEVYPRVRNGGMRLDARPDEGPPGCSLALVQEQLLDLYGIEYGVLIPLQGHTFGADEAEYSAALCRAVNEAIRDEWLAQESRLRASLCVPYETPQAAAQEIRHWADDRRFVQVLLPTAGGLPLGQAQYWPIYAAAAEAGIPIAAHFGGMEQHRGAGWPSFYLEEHVWAGNMMTFFAMDLICQGVFERFPGLQVVLVEGGTAWAPSLMWAMDAGWSVLRDEVPRLRRAPSEYFREHFWFTTQPIEEPEDPRHLVDMIELSGMADRIVFASDYPHWDFDSPRTALRQLPKDLRHRILFENGDRLYRLGKGGNEGSAGR